MKHATVLAVALIFPTALVAQTSADSMARPITLDEAVRLAQRNAPAAVQAAGTIRSNAAAVRSAYAAFIPNINLSSNATRQGGDRFDSQGQLVPFTGQSWQYGSGLSANIELFDGGRRLFDIRAAKANLQASEANEIAQRFNVALNVKQQYFAVFAAREEDAAARSQLEQAVQQLKAATARVSAGAATKSDSLRSVIQVGNAQLALITAQRNLQIANASLTRLVGLPFIVTASPTDSSDTMTLAADSAQIAALAVRGPAVEQSQEAYDAARVSARSSITNYLPTVSLTWSRNGNGIDRRFGWGDERYAYGDNLRFNLSFPFFNQGTREEQIVRARVAEDNAEAQLRDTRLLAQQQFTQYLSSFRTAEQRVQIQEASVLAAEEDLRVQERRYSLGASTLLDVLTSQTTLTQARSALIQARFDARVAKAQLEALIGRDL